LGKLNVGSFELRKKGEGSPQGLAEREAELLPVPSFHVVFTLPAAITDLAYQNKAVADRAAAPM
jgi:hypothetical protein